MLAVKAKYENGTVRWERKPPVKGLHDLIVVFADVCTSDRTENGAEPSDGIGKNPENDERRIWADFSVANLDSAYGADEPEYSDAMLKTAANGEANA